MAGNRWRRWRSRCSVALVAPLLIGGTTLSSNADVRLLAAHNRERVASGVGGLQWDPALAASARMWADHLAISGAFEHAPERRQDPQGENIWAGSKGYYDVEAMVDAWIGEKRHYKPGSFPQNSLTGRVEDIGHYTQLMWRATGKVGCALATGSREDVLVCRYSEAGNYIGENPF